MGDNLEKRNYEWNGRRRKTRRRRRNGKGGRSQEKLHNFLLERIHFRSHHYRRRYKCVKGVKHEAYVFFFPKMTNMCFLLDGGGGSLSCQANYFSTNPGHLAFTTL
jgi:hypothetical protein